MFFGFLDPLYLLIMLPGLLLSIWASMYTKSTFAKFSQVRAMRGYTGAQAAHEMLTRNGVRDVTIELTRGFLSDHYDPRTKTLRLSRDVYHGQSLSAVGVACHEAGHALQHAHGYLALGLRTALVPAASIGSNFSYFILIFGFLLRSQPLVLVGIFLFSLAVLFTLITLPVEWNASARAKKAMVTTGMVSPQEQQGAAAVLNAAFMTYVAGAVSAVLMLLYYLLRSGLLGGGDD